MADMTPVQDYPETSLRDFYNVLFRQKKKIMVFFFSVMVVVSIGTLFGSKVFRSEAELLVRIGRENATVGPTVATGKVININQDRVNEINSEVDILKSRELAERVVDAVGAQLILKGARETLPPGAPLATIMRYRVRQVIKYPLGLLANLLSPVASSRQREKEDAIQSLMDRLNVASSTKSNIISLSYETNDPGLARNVLARLLGFYLEKHIEVNRTSGSYGFFMKQKNELRSSLARTEERLRDLKDSTGMASISGQRRILMGRIGEIKKDLADTESSASASTARVKALKETLARLPAAVRKGETTGFPDSAADSLRKSVYALELKEQELLSKYKEDTFPVQDIRRRIQQGKAMLAAAQQQSQVTTGINENYQRIQLDLLKESGNLWALKAKARTLKSQLKSAGVELDALNDAEMRFAQLDRDLSTQRSSYRKYSASLEQARIDEALDMERISNISIVEPATYAVKPVRPKKLLDLSLGFFLGIFGALGLAFFCEFQDHTLRKPEDIGSRLHLSVLAALPVVSNEEASNVLAAAGQSPIQAVMGSQLLLGANGNLVAIDDLLRLYDRRTPSAPCAIALVGCHSGEGVSTVAAHLARGLSQSSEGRVLLIDAEPGNPCQYKKFGVEKCPDLADFASNGRSGKACLQPATVENLDILTVQDGAWSASVLKTFSEVLPILRQQYCFIICDLPALLENSLVAPIAAMMDGVVLVVEAEKTRWEVANIARQALVQADSNVLGVILNKRRFHIPTWLYKTL